MALFRCAPPLANGTTSVNAYWQSDLAEKRGLSRVDLPLHRRAVVIPKYFHPIMVNHRVSPDYFRKLLGLIGRNYAIPVLEV